MRHPLQAMVSLVDGFNSQQQQAMMSSAEENEHTSAVEMPGAQEHVITARRSRDGFLTFDVRISHIIEQTLLRAFNRPNFRKSTIRVIDEGDGELSYHAVDTEEENIDSKNQAASTRSNNNNNNLASKGLDESEITASSSADRDLVPIKLQMKRKYAPEMDTPQAIDPAEQAFSKISSQEAEIFLKRGEWNLQPNTRTSETISAIPTSWLSRGISTDEKRQFERSIANASLCPHERKKVKDSSPDDPGDLTHQTIFEEDEELSDPFPTSTSPLEYSQGTPSSATHSSTSTHGATIPSAPVVPSLYIPQQQSRPKATSTYHQQHHSTNNKRRRSLQSLRHDAMSSPHHQDQGDHNPRAPLPGYEFSNSPAARPPHVPDPEAIRHTVASAAAASFMSQSGTTSIDFSLASQNPSCFD